MKLCKPDRQRLNIDIQTDLEAMIANDSDESVREMACQELEKILAEE